MKEGEALHYEDSNYSLRIQLNEDRISFHLQSGGVGNKSIFINTFEYEELPSQLKQVSPDILHIFNLLSHHKNFTVDHQTGVVALFARNVLKNEFVQKKIKFNLKDITQKHHRSTAYTLISNKDSPLNESHLSCWLDEDSVPLRPPSIQVNEESEEQKLKQLMRQILILERDHIDVNSSRKQLQRKLYSLERKIEGEQKTLHQLQKYHKVIIVLLILTFLMIIFSVKTTTKEILLQYKNCPDQNPQIQKQDHYKKIIESFQEQMKVWRQNISSTLKNAQKNEMKWKMTDNNGFTHEGNYLGELKMKKPNGVGGFSCKSGKWKVEGMWKDGLLHGHAIKYYENGDQSQYEVQNGKPHGMSIWQKGDGTTTYTQWKNGLRHGLKRVYEGHTIKEEELYENGKKV